MIKIQKVVETSSKGTLFTNESFGGECTHIIRHFIVTPSIGKDAILYWCMPTNLDENTRLTQLISLHQSYEYQLILFPIHQIVNNSFIKTQVVIKASTCYPVTVFVSYMKMHTSFCHFQFVVQSLSLSLSLLAKISRNNSCSFEL